VKRVRSMSRGRKIGWGVVFAWLGGSVALAAIYGVKGHKNESFQVIDTFHLEPWAHIVGPLDFNKGVLYLLIAAVLTVGLTLWVADRMQQRPGRLQTAIEWMYDLMLRTTRDTMDEQMTAKWFPAIFTLFVFILITNLIGYIPLPVNTGASFKLAGATIPAFQIYAADTNVAVPLVLALGVFIAFNTVGFRSHGFTGYFKSLVPAGVAGGMLAFIFPLEIISTFLRLLSLTIRLWANLLAGHLLIEFMAGDLAVLLGHQWLGWFTLPIGVVIFLFEAVLIAGLQAFIFAILTAIYIGGATSSH
jgi:F-type H+-transporting ATPase subunit a